MITIVNHAYEICTENVIKLIAYVGPSRGIHWHASRKNKSTAYKFCSDIEAPFGSMT